MWLGPSKSALCACVDRFYFSVTAKSSDNYMDLIAYWKQNRRNRYIEFYDFLTIFIFRWAFLAPFGINVRFFVQYSFPLYLSHRAFFPNSPLKIARVRIISAARFRLAHHRIHARVSASTVELWPSTANIMNSEMLSIFCMSLSSHLRFFSVLHFKWRALNTAARRFAFVWSSVCNARIQWISVFGDFIFSSPASFVAFGTQSGNLTYGKDLKWQMHWTVACFLPTFFISSANERIVLKRYEEETELRIAS